MNQRTLTWIWISVLALTLVACGAKQGADEPTTVIAESPPATDETPLISAETGSGQGMGPGSGMMARHHVTVPEPYTGLTNPVQADQASLERGADLYSALCASCHGDGGMGDGPAGANLDPVPAALAHSSHMLGDDLMFWRISEGGTRDPFNSAMPAWKDSLEEQARWDLINYARALGRGQVVPRASAGGASFDLTAEAAARAEMLANGIQQGVITEEESHLFDEIHAAMDEWMIADESPKVGGMDQMRDRWLAELVEQRTITQEQADAFNAIHDRLVEAGLME